MCSGVCDRGLCRVADSPAATFANVKRSVTTLANLLRRRSCCLLSALTSHVAFFTAGSLTADPPRRGIMAQCITALCITAQCITAQCIMQWLNNVICYQIFASIRYVSRAASGGALMAAATPPRGPRGARRRASQAVCITSGVPLHATSSARTPQRSQLESGGRAQAMKHVPGAGRSGRAVPRGPASYTINYHISPVYRTGGQGHGETEEMHRC